MSEESWEGNRRFVVQFVAHEDYPKSFPPVDDVDERLTAGMVEEMIKRSNANEGQSGALLFSIDKMVVVPERSLEDMKDFITFVWDRMEQPQWDRGDMWDAIIEGVRGLDQMTPSEIFDEYQGMWDEMTEEMYQQNRVDLEPVDPIEAKIEEFQRFLKEQGDDANAIVSRLWINTNYPKKED